MKHFQPADRHTVTPRIITPRLEKVVRFVKNVFRGQGEFQVSRPSEIRICDSVIMISDGGGLRDPNRGQVLDPQKVGRDLNVRTVLTGRVVQQKDALIIELS